MSLWTGAGFWLCDSGCVGLVWVFVAVPAMVLGAARAASVACDVVADHGDLSVAIEDDAGSWFGTVVFGDGDRPLVDRVIFACQVGCDFDICISSS